MATISYDAFNVSQQRSGSLTLAWSVQVTNGTLAQQASPFTSQSLLVDSDGTGLKTLVLDGAARTVTLSSDNITDIKYGTDVNYSFRIIGDTGTVGAAKIKSNTRIITS